MPTSYNGCMKANPIFTHTEPELLTVLAELRRREPIFHSQEFGTCSSDFERSTAIDYWEVGASGRRYSRAFILNELYPQAPAFADALGWETRDHALRQLGPDTYLMTYVLQQGDRLTRRATIWRRTIDGWCVLYHQGTIVSVEEDDVVPVKVEVL